MREQLVRLSTQITSPLETHLEEHSISDPETSQQTQLSAPPKSLPLIHQSLTLRHQTLNICLSCREARWTPPITDTYQKQPFQKGLETKRVTTESGLKYLSKVLKHQLHPLLTESSVYAKLGGQPLHGWSHLSLRTTLSGGGHYLCVVAEERNSEFICSQLCKKYIAGSTFKYTLA